MNIDPASTATTSALAPRFAPAGNRFTTVLAQYAVLPLFAPWPPTEQNIRVNPAATSVALSTHATASNRREGRHTRG